LCFFNKRISLKKLKKDAPDFYEFAIAISTGSDICSRNIPDFQKKFAISLERIAHLKIEDLRYAFKEFQKQCMLLGFPRL